MDQKSEHQNLTIESGCDFPCRPERAVRGVRPYLAAPPYLCLYVASPTVVSHPIRKVVSQLERMTKD